MAAQRTYLAIDLKSFYASVECVDRHLDPLTTNLVVADASRTEKTICLAVSPSLKAYKIPGRARLFEAVQRVKEVNAQRLQTAIQQHKAVRGEDGKYRFASTSFDANALNADPALGLSYIVARPGCSGIWMFPPKSTRPTSNMCPRRISTPTPLTRFSLM